MLTITLLGTPVITCNGKPFKIPRRQARYIFFYLLAEGGRAPRSALRAIISNGQDTPKSKLRNVLGQINNTLRTCHPDAGLRSNNDHLYVDKSLYEVDLWQWQTAFERIAPQLKNICLLSQGQAETLFTTARIWNGKTTLLDGVVYDNAFWQAWLRQKSSQLETQYRMLANVLLDLQSQYPWEAAQEDQIYNIIHRFITDEQLNRKYLNILRDAGEFDRARKHYHQIAHYYQEEGTPFPESLRALEAKIFSPHTQGIQQPIPFVVREKQLCALTNAFRQGGYVSLTGEAGAGKNFLVQQFLTRESLDAKHAIVTHCNRMNCAQPYYPLIEWLDENLHRMPPHSRENAAKILAYLDAPDKTPAAAAAFSKSFPINRWLQNIIREWAQEDEFVFVIHNIQWADEATLDFISRTQTKQHFQHPQHLLLFTLEPPLSPVLMSLIQQIKHNRWLKYTDISLGTLALDEINALSRQILGVPLHKDVLAELQRYANNNVSLLADILQNMAAHYAPDELQTMRALPLKPGISDFLANRLKRFSEEAKDVLYTLTALERPYSLDKLARILGMDHTTLLDNLSLLEKEHIITSTPENLYRPANSKATSLLFKNLPPTQQKRYHSRIAHALEADQVHQHQCSYLASHWERSGAWKKAIDCWLKAARYTDSFVSYQQATQALDKAEHILLQLPPEEQSADAIYQIYTLYGEISASNSTPQILLSAAQNLNRLLESHPEEALLSALQHNLMAHYYINTNQYSSALHAAQQAIDILLQHTRTCQQRMELSTAHRLHGVAHLRAGFMHNAYQDLRQALDLLDKIRQPDNILWLRHYLATNYHMIVVEGFRGSLDNAFNRAEEGMQLAARAEWRYGEIIHQNATSGLHYLAGRFEEAVENCKKGIIWATAKQDASPRILGSLYTYHSISSLELGHLDEALENAEKAIELGLENSYPEITSLGWRCKGDIYHHLNQYETAIAYYQKGIQAAPHTYAADDNRLRLYTSQIITGDSAAFEKFRHVVTLMHEQGLQALSIPSQIFLMLALAHIERWDQLLILEEETMIFFQQRPSQHHHTDGLFQITNAKRAISQGKYAEARKLANEVLYFFQEEARVVWLQLHTLNFLQRLTADSEWQEKIRSTLAQMQEHVPSSLQEAWEAYVHKALHESIL